MIVYIETNNSLRDSISDIAVTLKFGLMYSFINKINNSLKCFSVSSRSKKPYKSLYIRTLTINISFSKLHS